MQETNDLGQPVGPVVQGWSARERPPARVLSGRWCRLEPLDPELHAQDLFRANRDDEAGGMWTYLPYGPFGDLASYREWAQSVAHSDDPVFFAIVTPAEDRAVGTVALQRIDQGMGVVEVGNVAFSPTLQRTPAGTEAISLLTSLVFDGLGYRRCEWKCDSLNAASRRAASRFGFVYEGTFRKAMVIKGLSRDTAWFSIIDTDWPRVKAAYERWLSPENFHEDGSQRTALSVLTGGGIQQASDTD